MFTPLNPFESLLFLEHVAPFILRVPLGLFLLSGSVVYARGARTHGGYLMYGMALIQTLVGLSILFGYYTQLGALLGLLEIGWISIMGRRHPEIIQFPAAFYILAGAIYLSLLVTGAGHFAFDLSL